MPIILTICAFIATFIGGLVGLRYKDRMHLILGLTAGVLLGVVAFDILPEIMTLVEQLRLEPIEPMIALVAGFLIFHIFEKALLIHTAQETSYGHHKHPTVGVFSALALSGHSFMDGVGIGLGFQVSTEVGLLVAMAVIAHDFSDGLNTVSLLLAHKNSDKKAVVFLVLDALAPVLGGLSTLLFQVPDRVLVSYLGFFAGFLLYIGASDILPEAHSQNSSVRTIAMTVIGVVFIFVVTRFT